MQEKKVRDVEITVHQAFGSSLTAKLEKPGHPSRHTGER